MRQRSGIGGPNRAQQAAQYKRSKDLTRARAPTSKAASHASRRAATAATGSRGDAATAARANPTLRRRGDATGKRPKRSSMHAHLETIRAQLSADDATPDRPPPRRRSVARTPVLSPMTTSTATNTQRRRRRSSAVSVGASGATNGASVKTSPPRSLLRSRMSPYTSPRRTPEVTSPFGSDANTQSRAFLSPLAHNLLHGHDDWLPQPNGSPGAGSDEPVGLKALKGRAMERLTRALSSPSRRSPSPSGSSFASSLASPSSTGRPHTFMQFPDAPAPLTTPQLGAALVSPSRAGRLHAAEAPVGSSEERPMTKGTRRRSLTTVQGHSAVVLHARRIRQQMLSQRAHEHEVKLSLLDDWQTCFDREQQSFTSVALECELRLKRCRLFVDSATRHAATLAMGPTSSVVSLGQAGERSGQALAATMGHVQAQVRRQRRRSSGTGGDAPVDWSPYFTGLESVKNAAQVTQLVTAVGFEVFDTLMGALDRYRPLLRDVRDIFLHAVYMPEEPGDEKGAYEWLSTAVARCWEG